MGMETFRVSSCCKASCLALVLIFSVSLHRLTHVHSQMGIVDTGLEGITNDQGVWDCVRVS